MLGSVRAYEGNEPYIFISYAHKDSGKVLPVISALYEHKYRVWYDEGIAPGSEWPQNIARHLQKAAVVIAFVSENSLRSPNCENEILLSASQKKETIQICLDGAPKHPLLSGGKALDYGDGLIDGLTDGSYLGGELIGDGIIGYQYSIEIKRNFNIWNLMLGLAAVLVIVFSVTLFGLYNGWFDDLLPAAKKESETAAPTPQPQEEISVESNLLSSVLSVDFSSDEEKSAVYDKLGWQQPYEMKYSDIMEMDWITNLEIWDEPIYGIGFAAYLPNLEEVSLMGSRITDLSPLVECPKLKVVRVSADMLPITLPEPRNFEVEVS